MATRLRGLAWTAIAYLLGIHCAAAQEDLTLVVDGRVLDAQITEFIAEVGEPQEVQVKAGQSVKDVVREHCGRENNDYLGLLQKTPVEGLPSPALPDSLFEKATTVRLPACLKLPPFEVKSREAKKNDSPWKYYSSDTAGFQDFQPAEALAVARLQAVSHFSDYFDTYLSAFAELNPDYAVEGQISEGATIRVPQTPTTWASISLRTDIISREQVVDELTGMLIQNGQDPRITFVEYPEEIKPLSSLSKKALQDSGSCQNHNLTDKARYPFDPYELTLAISNSIRLLKETIGGRTPDSTTIVIADTGLYSNERTPFSANRLDLQRLRGIPLGPNRSYRPNAGQSQHQHGTQVASVAFGGPAVMPIFDLLGLDMRISPINIFEELLSDCTVDGTPKICPTYKVKTDVFNQAIEATDNAILNLSVSRSTPFKALETHLGRQSHRLFVVAAGNEGSRLSDRAVFPARYGGQMLGTHNLITVAALDYDRTLAHFSNWSDKHVDIATFGCHIPILEYDEQFDSYRTAEASGTSFSAPLVSFASAAVMSLWPNATPEDVKTRILVSADISDSLRIKKQVADGRVLNIVKAVSLYQDVVQAQVDGEVRLIRGAISADQTHFSFCDADLNLFRKLDSNRSKIRKIAPITDADTGKKKLLLYSQSPQGEFQSDTCPMHEFTISVTESFTEQQYTFGASEIIDVVFAE